MPQTLEAQTFLSEICALPKDTSVLLDDILKHSVDEETEIRRLFATDPGNARLKDPHVGLVDVFDAPQDIRMTRARVVRDDLDLSERYIMPLSQARRRKEGSPAMVADIDEFRNNWAIFTENSLSLLDWTNIVAAGGSVLACITPVPEPAKESKRSLRKYFHTDKFPTSDIDLFLYGLNSGQAEAKVVSVYQAVRDSIPWDCTCIRTKHSISIHSQYPYRCVQIVLRLYSSMAEILAGFDVDAPCCAYDGTRVLANPRAIIAMMRQCNTIDITRRSPSYEVRLSKYSHRDFEVQVPNLRRQDIDPTIFERSVARVPGLARLIVLERLYSPESRAHYLNFRRDLRGRPAKFDVRRPRNVYKRDLKADSPEEALVMNSYDVVSLHIPYGPGWDARRTNKLVYQTDLGMNSPFNPKNKGKRLHRHPAFFGSIGECLTDCCEFCPEPRNEDEKNIQEGNDDVYVRGRIQFIQENPGRQSISGSFHPIDDGEWTEQAYIGESEKLCKAIQFFDRVTVLRMINVDGTNVNRRDPVGRTPLHVAIICRTSDIACDLIDFGAKMTARLADGRTALHLAAQFDLPDVVRKLLQRSTINREEAEAAEVVKESDKEANPVDEDDPMGGDSEDGERDWEEVNSSNDGRFSENEDEEVKDDPKSDDGSKDSGIPDDDDNQDLPDILDINLPDWDFGLTPLGYAIIFGSFGALEELIVAGADPVRVTTLGADILHPLTLTVLTEDEDRASRIMERLLQAGATSSTADASLLSIFHRIVCAQKPGLVSTLLRADPKAKLLVNFPSANSYTVVFPSVSAIQSGDYATLALLLTHGAKVSFDGDDLQSARDALEHQDAIPQDYMRVLHSSNETALARNDYIIHLLVELGADVSLPTRLGLSYAWGSNQSSLLDWVDAGIRSIDEKHGTATVKSKPMDESPSFISGWKTFHLDCIRNVRKRAPALSREARETKQKEEQDLLKLKEYLEDVKALFAANNAKSWDELYPDKPVPPVPSQMTGDSRKVHEEVPYKRFASAWHPISVAENQVDLYDQLYEACWTGDTETIEELCLPKDASKSPQWPLQIVTVTSEGSISPFFVAIHRRHWTTARLILTIAAAQELKTDEGKPTSIFSTVNLKLDDDSQNEDSEDDDDEIEADESVEINLIDVAQRKAAARYAVGPDQIFLTKTEHPEHVGSEHSINIVGKAIVDGDFEAFVRILDMCKTLPKHVALDQVVDTGIIFSKDSVEFLDEYIRRTGRGIHFPTKRIIEDGKPDRPKGKEYWGLNIHGRKRKDLASAGNQEAVHTIDDAGPTPLVWEAALYGAAEILKYLAGPRPLAAYRYYLSTNSDKPPRDISDLNSVFPQKLGWCSNSVNDTPLVAAVSRKRLDSVKTLLFLQPKLMKEYLHYNATYSGFNLVLRAVEADCSPELIDYLLDNGVTATHFDLRCWNVTHVACAMNRKTLLEHLLRKLSKDVVDDLLVQQSKPYLNTPLHIAVRSGKVDMVKLISTTKTSAFLLRDVNGFTPLHAAVKLGYSEIATILAAAGPPEALYMENAVGEIPVETASQQDLIDRLRDNFRGRLIVPESLPFRGIVSTYPDAFDVQVRETKIHALKKMIEELVKEGRLTPGTKLFKALVEFSDKMDNRIAESRAQQVELNVDDEGLKDKEEAKDVPNNDCRHQRKTLECVRKAMHEKPTMHRLSIHLSDVQKSVLNTPQINLARTVTEMELKGFEDEPGNETSSGGRNWLEHCVTPPDIPAGLNVSYYGTIY